jgi:hypothetical protein
MRARIAILTEAIGPFRDGPYLLKELARIWQQDGLEVELVADPGYRGTADLAIQHVDLTVIPPEYVKLGESFEKCLNGGVVDVSKRVVSRNLLSMNDTYSEPVIVKTNNNHGGLPEALVASAGWRSGYLTDEDLARTGTTITLSQGRSASLKSYLSIDEYKVYDSIDKVPPEIWSNRNLVVEKFLPERHQELYCLRTWVFFGDKETNSLCYSHDPVVKSHTVVRREVVADVPDDLREMRRELGFDYGKFDYAIVDGRTVLYDANRTPTIAFNSEQVSPSLQLFASGIHSYL